MAVEHFSVYFWNRCGCLSPIGTTASDKMLRAGAHWPTVNSPTAARGTEHPLTMLIPHKTGSVLEIDGSVLPSLTWDFIKNTVTGRHPVQRSTSPPPD